MEINKRFLDIINYLNGSGYAVVEIFHQSRPDEVYYWVVASGSAHFRYNRKTKPTDEISIRGNLINEYLSGNNPLTTYGSAATGVLDSFLIGLPISEKQYSLDYSFMIHDKYLGAEFR